MQKVLENGSTMFPICVWGLHVQAMKLPLMPYVSCVTKWYQMVLCYLQTL